MIPRKVNNRGTDWKREREKGGNRGKKKRVMASKYDDDDDDRSFFLGLVTKQFYMSKKSTKICLLSLD